jgi:hypothetical protein
MKKSKLIPIIIFFMTSSALLYAPPPGGMGGGGSVPVDGGILALIAGVIAFGYKSFKNKKGE